MGPGHLEHIALIGNMWSDDLYVHPGFGGVAQGSAGGHIDDQVGRGDIDILSGPGDHVQIYRLCHPLVVQGGVGVGLDISRPGLYREGRRTEAAEVLLPIGDVVPHGQKHHRHRPGGVPLQADHAVLPVAEAHLPVHILVRQIDAAGKGGLAVHHDELPVVPVVQPQGHQGHEPVEHPALDAPGGHLLVIVPGQGVHTPHVVIDQAHLHPLGGLALQDVQDAVPERPRLDDEILQKNIPLGPLQILQDPGHGQVARNTTSPYWCKRGRRRSSPDTVPVRRHSPSAPAGRRP